ncbi:hypothetical protein [Nitratifractor salsuginis]|uniref:Uncharacterized protein n=1 Tax=Nitratifractor salsuginis (strain DSM 16511 / JCM 12458 / E9I37-1) TaxID=749222 RepID=E6X1L8_NITSE|nr:hypothetical protein [Nitratifractor salsuginis]ADV47009.1 hypothetical protein Nitsa_1764 [Nitratifractor salsuginis DSM 16511]
MKITQKDIARYFGLSEDTITKWKKGSVEQQRRYYAMREYYERQHRGWEIDYQSGKATHPNIVVKISEEPTAPFLICDKMVSLGFDKKDDDGVRHFYVAPLEIDKSLWKEAEKGGGKSLARLMSQLGDAFDLDKWGAAHT